MRRATLADRGPGAAGNNGVGTGLRLQLWAGVWAHGRAGGWRGRRAGSECRRVGWAWVRRRRRAWVRCRDRARGRWRWRDLTRGWWRWRDLARGRWPPSRQPSGRRRARRWSGRSDWHLRRCGRAPSGRRRDRRLDRCRRQRSLAEHQVCRRGLCPWRQLGASSGIQDLAVGRSLGQGEPQRDDRDDQDRHHRSDGRQPLPPAEEALPPDPGAAPAPRDEYRVDRVRRLPSICLRLPPRDHVASRRQRARPERRISAARLANRFRNRGRGRRDGGTGRAIDSHLVVPRSLPQGMARQAAESPQPDRVVDEPGQPNLAGRIARHEPGQDRDKTEDCKRPDDPFHG